MKENKRGFLGQTIYRPKLMNDSSEEKEMPRIGKPHHEEYLDHFPNSFEPGIQ